ncbi:KdsC family phosphatase [Arachidicoccus terrestris]|uniref:KdsC family phosphatase n=1 Tax=Arachidicoccus terrestris TaxID=2875539 RepID=UPI001CC49DB7|nr:HAD hydrolase family protein [Arachidicoccus terrestris]UAY56325.1 HAD hydrolase family protein [Arachidicoccus terrestris]
MNALELFRQVKAFVFDIDGVMTDNTVLVLPDFNIDGKIVMARTMSVRDGYAIQLAVKLGYPVAVISGGKETGAGKRLHDLGVKHVFMDVKDKVACFEAFISEYDLDPSSVLFMGDDIPDYQLMQITGIKTCPADACNEIKAIASYLSPIKGGQGCVRDVIEKTLKLQNNWPLTTDIKAQ